MAKRVNDGVELIKTPPGKGRGGSMPKSPKAVARSASLEASRSVPDHDKAKRRLTAETVASSTLSCRCVAASHVFNGICERSYRVPTLTVNGSRHALHW